MDLKVNGVVIASPSEFKVTILDLDDGEASTRTADGTMHRDRIAVKRQVDMAWGFLKWSEISAILQGVSSPFFSFTYPDPMTGSLDTKTFYAGNRPAPMAVAQGSEIFWADLRLTITEQ
jgi:hypothetical protein